MTNVDFIQFDGDQGQSLLEVIFSDPIIRDVKHLETNNSNNIVAKVDIKKKKVVEEDDRGVISTRQCFKHFFIFCVSGASSPDSYGSSKENDPEMCSVSNVFHQQSKSAYSTRKRNGLKTSLSKPALAS